MANGKSTHHRVCPDGRRSVHRGRAASKPRRRPPPDAARMSATGARSDVTAEDDGADELKAEAGPDVKCLGINECAGQGACDTRGRPRLRRPKRVQGQGLDLGLAKRVRDARAATDPRVLEDHGRTPDARAGQTARTSSIAPRRARVRSARVRDCDAGHHERGGPPGRLPPSDSPDVAGAALPRRPGVECETGGAVLDLRGPSVIGGDAVRAGSAPTSQDQSRVSLGLSWERSRAQTRADGGVGQTRGSRRCRMGSTPWCNAHRDYEPFGHGHARAARRDFRPWAGAHHPSPICQFSAGRCVRRALSGGA